MTEDKCKALYGVAEEAIDRLHKITDLANGHVTQDDIRDIYQMAYAGDLHAVLAGVDEAEWQATDKADTITLDVETEDKMPAWAKPYFSEAPEDTAEDAEWPKVGDTYWTWPCGVSEFQGVSMTWDGMGNECTWFRDGEVFRTEAEAEAEWHKRYGKKEEPVASEPVTLNADEMAMVANGQMIPAIKALRVRRFGATGVSMPLKDAGRIVDAYRASIKASEPPPVNHVAIKPPCPTGVPENGDWMPETRDRFWVPGDSDYWVWNGNDAQHRHLAAGDVCRYRWIARTVQRRRGGAAKGGAE